MSPQLLKLFVDTLLDMFSAVLMARMLVERRDATPCSTGSSNLGGPTRMVNWWVLYRSLLLLTC